MDKKGSVNRALSVLFQWDGVIPKMIVNGLKEQTLGFFNSKVAEDSCKLR